MKAESIYDSITWVDLKLSGTLGARSSSQIATETGASELGRLEALYLSARSCAGKHLLLVFRIFKQHVTPSLFEAGFNDQ